MPSLTLFGDNQTFYNPGAIGNRNVLAANFFARQNWVGLDNAPSTQVFSAHAPLRNPAVAMGINLEHDVIHIRNYTGIYLNYAYRIRFGGANRLSMGLKLGIFSTSQDYLNMRDENLDPTNSANSFHLPNAGVGFLFTSEQYWAGLSVPRLFGIKSEASDTYKVDPSSENYEFFLTGGTTLNASADIKLEPSLMFIYNQLYKYKVAVNTIGTYRNVYKAGLGYRHNDAIIFIFGYNINRQFSVGYSYDLTISELKNISSGSHELQLQYLFGYKVNASNPRGF